MVGRRYRLAGTAGAADNEGDATLRFSLSAWRSRPGRWRFRPAAAATCALAAPSRPWACPGACAT